MVGRTGTALVFSKWKIIEENPPYRYELVMLVEKLNRSVSDGIRENL